MNSLGARLDASVDDGPQKHLTLRPNNLQLVHPPPCNRYGAILVSKFNNILTNCDISFWCTDFQEGYIFWGRNFQVYIFPEGVANFLKWYIFGWYKFKFSAGVRIWVHKFHNYGPAQNFVSRQILSKIATAFEVCFYGFPVMQTRTCRSTTLCSRIVEAGSYYSCLSVARVITRAN